MSSKKGPQRRCPICAETVKADAVKCRSCGSTLAVTAGLSLAEPPRAGKKGGKDAKASAADAWPAPGPGDVGLTGVGAVLGAIVGFGLGAWVGAHVLFVLAGAAAGGALGRARG